MLHIIEYLLNKYVHAWLPETSSVLTLFVCFPALHLSAFVHASLIRHHLFISPPLCTVIPTLDLCLAFSPSIFLLLVFRWAFTCRQQPCINVQPPTNHSATFILSSTSNHSRPLGCSLIFPKVLWIHRRLHSTSVSVTLSRRFTASLTVITVIRKQAPAINLNIEYVTTESWRCRWDYLTRLLLDGSRFLKIITLINMIINQNYPWSML